MSLCYFFNFMFDIRKVYVTHSNGSWQKLSNNNKKVRAAPLNASHSSGLCLRTGTHRVNFHAQRWFLKNLFLFIKQISMLNCKNFCHFK